MMDLLTVWPFVSLILGLTMSAQLFLSPWSISHDEHSDLQTTARWKKRFQDPKWWQSFALPLYMLHEFEEHGYDILGRRYHFQVALCNALV